MMQLKKNQPIRNWLTLFSSVYKVINSQPNDKKKKNPTKPKNIIFLLFLNPVQSKVNFTTNAKMLHFLVTYCMQNPDFSLLTPTKRIITNIHALYVNAEHIGLHTAENGVCW